MRLDTEALEDGFAPPEITIKGRRYVGRILSIAQWLPFEPWIAKFATLRPTEQLAFCRLYLRTIFPWRPSYLWRGDPVKRVMGLPFVEFCQVMTNFFVCQARSMATSSAPAPEIPGTRPGSSSAPAAPVH